MHEIWTEDQAKSWGKSVALMQQRYKRSRTLRRMDAFLIAGFFPIIVGFGVYGGGNPLLITPNACFWWFFYRQYRINLAAERLWLEAANHGQRMLVETIDRALWHSEQLDVCLAAINAIDKSTWFTCQRDLLIACCRSWFWWLAFKVMKRVRIFLEWWNCKERS